MIPARMDPISCAVTRDSAETLLCHHQHLSNALPPHPFRPRAPQEGEMPAEMEMEDANKTGTAGGKKQKVRGD